MYENPEADQVTVKLRELQCRCYAELQRTDETMKCANRVLQVDNGSIEGKKWRCQAHMQLKRWDAAIADCQNAAQSGEQEARQMLEKAKRMKHKSEQKDYYGVLNAAEGIDVTEKSDDKTIKKAYRKLAMVYHPDRVNGEEEKKAAGACDGTAAGVTNRRPGSPPFPLATATRIRAVCHADRTALPLFLLCIAEAKFQEIAEAYEILSDPEKRGKFDRGEEIKPEGQQQHHHNPFGQQFHFNMG
eukprot:SAG22_NODE_4562_length_1232_cov_1.649603_2_plen_244_part_00